MTTTTITDINDDPRIGELITTNFAATDTFDVMLVGFPNDDGVARNGGRIGSKAGPHSLRKLMKRVGTTNNPEFNINVAQFVKLADAGNIKEDNLELEEAHVLLTKLVQTCIQQHKAVPFVVGGGNDQSFPNALALLQSVSDMQQVGVINIDAHLDVRPQKHGKEHSGSPFRRLLETPGFLGSNFVEFAAQGTQCSAIHAQFITEQHKGKIYWLSQVQKQGAVTLFKQVLQDLPEHVFVSFDIDSIVASDCPGVSCPSAIGLTAQEALDICFEAGYSGKCKLFDLSEYNPLIEEYRTGRLVAYMFAYFCMGIAKRKQEQV